MKKTLLTLLMSFSIIGNCFAADKFQIDQDHSSINFSVKHLVISNTKGNFKNFDGIINYDAKDITKSSVNAKIKADSIDTDNEKRDEHLKTPEFLDTTKYPEITFISKQIKKAKGNNNYICIGNLTMHGVTKEIALPFQITGLIKGMKGESRLGANANIILNRKDFGLNWNKAMDNGGLVIGEQVKVSLEIEAVKQ
jgi:polyisoprenoid-binding protein YceI